MSFLFKVIRKIKVCGNLLDILEVFKTLDDLENLVCLLLVKCDCCVGNLVAIETGKQHEHLIALIDKVVIVGIDITAIIKAPLKIEDPAKVCIPKLSAIV